MIELATQGQMETENRQNRAIPTLTIASPVTLSGKDANGVEFTERAKTIVIARRGGKIAAKRNLTPGSEMTLSNPILGRLSRIRVLRVEKKEGAEEAYEVEVQLLGSENIWGIEFPSPDGEESSADTSPCEVFSCLPGGGWNRSTKPAETGILAAAHAARSLPAPQASPRPTLVAVPAQETDEETELISTGRLAIRPPKLTPAGYTASKLEGRDGEGAEYLERLEGTLQACRGELWQLTLELERFKQAVRDEMDQALQQVQESRSKPMEMASSDVEGAVKENTEWTEQKLDGFVRQRVQQEAAANLEILMQGALTRLQSAAEEESRKASEEFQGLFERLIQKGQDQLVQTIRSMTPELQNELRQIPPAAPPQTEISQARSACALTFEAELQKTADEVAESVAKQLRGQVEDTLLLMGEELKTIGQERLAKLKEEFSETLADMEAATAQTMKEISTQMERQVCELKKASDEVHQESARALAQAKETAAQIILEVYVHTRRGMKTLNDLRDSLAKETRLLDFERDLEPVTQHPCNGS
jgi:predicted metal-dependent hydrolase